MPKEKDSRLKRAGVSGFNKPKRTPSHPKKSHVVVAKEGDKIKTIRFGEQGAKPRINIHSKQYQDNWEKIFGDKNKKQNKK